MSDQEKLPKKNFPEAEDKSAAARTSDHSNLSEQSAENDVQNEEVKEVKPRKKTAAEKEAGSDGSIEGAMLEESKANEARSAEEQKVNSPEASIESDADHKLSEEEREQQELEELEEETIVKSNGQKDAQSELDEAMAEDREDESAGERHGIEKKDYHAMSKEELVEELEKLLQKEKIQAIKEHVDEIRAEFNAKFDEEVEDKKEEFLADGGNIIDFHYSTPLKKKFNSLYFDYREKKNKYFQQLKQDLNKNLDRRLEIIEELKNLIDVEENINTTYRHFKELQEKWRTAGAIPRDKYNTVWNTYHHHVENFYDFLHLNREFRDLDFKHNLEQKLKIISRAEELTQEEDTNRAFRELQMLHKMWKEDLGPVEKQYREDIWNKFSEATRKIHDKRQEYYNQLEREFEKNLENKEKIIEQIAQIASKDYQSHKEWQEKIKEIEKLREAFFAAGKVPRDKNEATWKKFKEAVRGFNRKKNAYYKNQKREQYDNLVKKQELVKIAEEHQDSEDFKETTPLMKKIQSEWKAIGHVPRKDSDKIWKRFKAACNHYFDRLHASRNAENQEENEAFDQKKELLDQLKNIKFSGERKQDLELVKSFIEKWKKIGRVSYNKRYIEGKFNKELDQAFEKLDLDKKQTEMLKYENKVQALEQADDTRKINNEHYFLTKKIEETKAEIRQLENNLQFFSNVETDNPLVKEVHNNIERHKEQLKIWQEKLEKVNELY